MRRHPALVELSRDHHRALVVAFALRHATEETAGAAAGSFLAHWECHERHHFRLEEEHLLPAYAAYGDVDDPVVARVLRDHLLIRRDAARLPDVASLELVRGLGARLAAHVKLEETRLFPMIEAALPEPELRALGSRLAG